MGTFSYQKLQKRDIPAFIELRIEQLQEEGAEAVFNLTPALYAYYDKHIDDGTFVAWLALDDKKIVATSGMSFIEKPPYYSNPTGKIGILSSMYTLKSYRRKGIAKQLLDKVVNEARLHGCGVVQITASDVGVFLYKAYGFHKNSNFLQLKL